MQNTRVVDPYSFFPDPDPEYDVGDQYGSGSWIRILDPDPIRIQGFNDQKLKKKLQLKIFVYLFLIKNCNLPIPRPPLSMSKL
jgi:hypothetical protein